MPISYTRLLQFSQQFRKYYARQFAPLLERTGLTMREVHVLLFLTGTPGYDTARDVAEGRGLAKSQVSQAVEQLSSRGLLCRTSDTADRRLVRLTITEAGEPLAKEAQAIQAACGKRLLEGFTTEEEAQLRGLLETVLENGAHLMEEDHTR